MAIENRTKDYISHKYKRTVYVNLNPKTKVGSDLIGQYKEQTRLHCMDLGRIGYHDEHGRYKIDFYTTKELIVIPKLIIRVTERAMSRAGRDVYELRTYMSKFGQLNFLLVVDKDYADLILVENVYIENLNHRENYETLLWRLSYYNQKPLPLAEIFYKYGIKANPDDYGKSWKEDVKINNVLATKSKAMMSIEHANKVGSAISQKALVTSLNNLNKEGAYGKKITEAYSAKVAKNAEINKLASSPKLENTLNHILVKTLEEQTTKKDLTDPANLRVYKRVIDVQLSTPSAVCEEVEKLDTKENFKNYLMGNYQNKKNKNTQYTDENIIFDQKQSQFEKIISHTFSKEPVNEKTEKREEKIEIAKVPKRNLPKEFFDFDNKKVLVDVSVDRFYIKENPKDKKLREKKEKFELKAQKKQEKELQKANKRLRKVNAKCDIEAEFERSKTLVGLTPDYEKARNKVKSIFDKKEKSKLSKRKKIEAILNNSQEEQTSSEIIIDKIQKKIKRQSAKVSLKEQIKQNKEKERERKKQLKLQEKEEKKKKRNNTALLAESKKEKKNKTIRMAMLSGKTKEGKVKDENKFSYQNTRPVVRQLKEKQESQQESKSQTFNQRPEQQLQNKQELVQDLNQKIKQQEPVEYNANVSKNKHQVQDEKPFINSATQPTSVKPKEEMRFDITLNKSVKKEKSLDM